MYWRSYRSQIYSPGHCFARPPSLLRKEGIKITCFPLIASREAKRIIIYFSGVYCLPNLLAFFIPVNLQAVKGYEKTSI
jgi:hypothetical protein